MEVFAQRYLRASTSHDVARLLDVGKSRGFPRMLDSLDSTAWAGQYAGRSGSPTIILEVVADYDLCIWHVYFSMIGSNNDINVLEA